IKEPFCSGPENWPASMGYVKLKNAKIITFPIEPKKTKVSMILSEKIEKDLYRQIHDVEYWDTKGNHYRVFTISNASSEECSMSDVKVFRVEEVK
ncbi:MAG: hypothetical protein P8144_03690, partial [Gammaproteobacteria bacterium]